MESAPRDAIEQEVPASALDRIFVKARTYRAWLHEDVPDGLLREVYDLMRLGPTSSNSCPARILFVRSDAAKERLLPTLSKGNREKSRTAPVVALIAYDTEFYEKLSKLAPHSDARAKFAGDPALSEETAFRNSSLQGAYFIMAARALGLDCGPMSGFDAEKLNAEFFPGGKWKVNFVCNLGHGDPSRLHPRAPRLDFEEACRII